MTKIVPTALKKLHGNPGNHPLPKNEPEGVGDLWAPPEWFDDEQRAQWHYALEYAPPGLLTGTDREALVIWCVACVEHARAVVEVRRSGQIVKTKDGNVIQNPYLGVVNRQAMIMLKAGGELGFSPAARASLGDRAPQFGGGPLLNPKSERVTRGAARGSLAAYLAEKPYRLNS